MSEWKTDYKLGKWNNPEELVTLMAEMQAQGFRTELTRVYHSDDNTGGGWTIFTKSYDVAPPMTSFKLPASVVWDAMNSTEMYQLVGDYDDPRRAALDLVTNRIKSYYNTHVTKHGE